MKAYLDIVRRVLNEGKPKVPVRMVDGKAIPVDGGVKTIGLPNVVFSHDMSEGFPLLTSKKMATKAMMVELQGFIAGVTHKQWYLDRGCKIWQEWSNPVGCPNWFSNEERKEHQRLDCDLGPVYGYQWRNYNKQYVPRPRNILGEEPTVSGVGVRGNAKSGDPLYPTWTGMLRRCYVTEDKDYKNYGAKGIYVCNRWLVFEYFSEDVKKIEGWENKWNDWNNHSLDKDFHGKNCYGLNTCRWASHHEQQQIKQTVRPIYALSPGNGVFYHNSIAECAEFRR